MTDDFEDIRNAIESVETSMIKTEDDIESRIGITTTDPIEIANARISMLMSKNAALEARVNKLENLVAGLVANRSENRTKQRITIPTRDLFGYKPPNDVMSINSRASSVVDSPTNRADSMSMHSNSIMPEFMNPFSTAMPEGPRLIVTKSSSATAAMGYDRKASVWGTALASMLIAATRYYITKTDAMGIMIDEVKLMKNCTHIVPVLYTTSMHKELPSVKDPMTKYLSESISRKDKNEVPMSTAEDWYHFEKNQDGKNILVVLNTLITIAKEVPEVVMHPVSQIVSILIPPVVREVDGVVKFAMIAKEPINPVPNQWERWCMLLKDAAMTKYIKHRLSGATESSTMSKLANEMKQSELVEKKNMMKFSEMHMPANPDF